MPRAENLYKLAGVLDVSLEELLKNGRSEKGQKGKKE
jgi:transcriptional regulator with XRE-family HTH domain